MAEETVWLQVIQDLTLSEDENSLRFSISQTRVTCSNMAARRSPFLNPSLGLNLRGRQKWKI